MSGLKYSQNHAAYALPWALVFLAAVAPLEWAQMPAPGYTTAEDAGRRAYEIRCAHCHGSDLSGIEGRPSVVASVTDRTDTELIAFLRKGRPNSGMPAFPVAAIPNPEMTALIGHLRKITQTIAPAGAPQSPQPGMPRP